jgi:hypothetical protein
MNKHLFFFTWQLRPTTNGVILDKVSELLKSKSNDISFIYCDGLLKPCITNPEGRESLCAECRFNSKISLHKFGKNIKITPLSKFLKNKSEIDNIDMSKYTYSSIEEIKKLKYKDINIGFGALSSYISLTRNLEPIFDNLFIEYFNKLLKYQICLIDVFNDIFESEDINFLHLFNGRMADIRPVFELAKVKKINQIVYELIREDNDVFYRHEFINELPLSISANNNFINSVWDNSKLDYEEKIKMGSSFFINRRRGILTRDIKIYINNQEKGILPESWNTNKKNIVIFGSSEDEYAAIGDEFEKFALFESQEKAIIEILTNHTDTNTQFYLRIHPNLNNIDYGYHKRLYSISEQFKNIEIISPKSKISTYDLAEKADLVIVFGSSVGVESCFWGKPVINLAGSFYYFLNVSHIPKTKEELYQLLKSNKLEVKPKINAIKFGYYLMNIEDYTDKCNYSPIHLKIFGKYFGSGFEFLKIGNSMILYKIVLTILRKFDFFSFLHSKDKVLTIPIKGE